MQIRFAAAALLGLVLFTLAVAACSEIPPETPAQRALDACEDARAFQHDYSCVFPSSADAWAPSNGAGPFAGD